MLLGTLIEYTLAYGITLDALIRGFKSMCYTFTEQEQTTATSASSISWVFMLEATQRKHELRALWSSNLNT
jgi:hypothetical protein